MPTFQLVTATREQLGYVELGRPDWPAGSIIYRGDGPNLRVLDHIEDAPQATLVVEDVARPSAF